MSHPVHLPSAPSIAADPARTLRDVARSILRKNAFLALREHHGALPRRAFYAILAVLLAIRIYCIACMLVAWQGALLDPAYWASPGHPISARYFTPLYHHPNPFGWRFGFQLFVSMHNVTGLLLFLTCLVPLFAKKGAPLHVRVGRAFVVVWLVHLVDGLINSGQIMLVRGFDAQRYLDVTGQGFSLYLYIQYAFISSMVIDFLAHGMAALQYKNHAPPAGVRAIMLFLPITSLLFGIGITIWGILRLAQGGAPETPNTYPFAVVYVVQIPAYLYLIGRNIQYWLRPEPRAWLHGWLMEHQRNMMFCVQVTVYTGLANLASRFVPVLTPVVFGAVDVGFFVWLLMKERALRRQIVSSRMGMALLASMRGPARVAPVAINEADQAWILRVFDLDRSGHVELAEIERILAAQGIAPTKDELDRLRKELDRDGSGAVDARELGAFLSRWLGEEPTTDDALALAFRSLDRDADGQVTIGELEQKLREGDDRLSPGELGALFRAIDLDGSGAIDWDEFVAAMRPTAAPSAAERRAA